MQNTLLNHKNVWRKKPLLREIYFDWYRMIKKDLVPGNTVELGSGTGNFKEFMPEVTTTDIDPQPWLDKVFDAHTMPFKSGSISNLVMIDVFHHLSDPIKFLHEAVRVLKKGGRLLMIEPYPSPLSLLVYKLFHPEPFIFYLDYYNLKNFQTKKPWDSNQAIPYLIFFKHLHIFRVRFNNKFRVIRRERFSFLTYPLSGGFKNKQLIPLNLKSFTDAIENKLRFFEKYLAFRCYVVLEKQNIKQVY